MLKRTIEQLLLKKNLSSEESTLAIHQIFTEANSYQIAAFFMLMRAKGETIDELFGIIEGMRHFMIPIEIQFPVLDIVGTGGDGAHTLNISTASAILAASCGVKIAKHGNRSVSSLCGSADVLEVLGINIEDAPEKISLCIKDVGIGFLFAPAFHPALVHLKEIRKGLGIRTFMNIIAPLLNPARAQYLMLGVYSEELLEVCASLLMRLSINKAFVFHGSGLDELSCIGPSKVLEVSKEGIRSFDIDPLELGLKRCNLQDLKGRDAHYNAQKILEAFNGEPSAFADTIALNAGVALYLYGKSQSIIEGIEIAQSHLKEKKASEFLKRWKDYA